MTLHLLVAYKGRKTHPSCSKTGSDHCCSSQSDLVTEDANEEGEEEGGADGEAAHLLFSFIQFNLI